MAAKKKEQKEKPLDKMTVKELRELALTMPEISGVHGKNKDELLGDIKKARGIEDAPSKKKSSTVREIKAKIKDAKAKKQAALEAKDKRMTKIYSRRLSKLKKKTRKAA
jgi:hypothetical protein